MGSASGTRQADGTGVLPTRMVLHMRGGLVDPYAPEEPNFRRFIRERLNDLGRKGLRLVPPAHAGQATVGLLPGLGTEGHHSTACSHAGRHGPP